MTVLRLAIPSPLRQFFDYLPPPDTDSTKLANCRPGCRLLVPFGQRELCGILVEKLAQSDIPEPKLRAALKWLDHEPLISPAVLKLCFWAADYYAHPPGEVLAAALPGKLRQGERWQPARETVWQLSLSGKGLPEGALARAPRQSELLRDLQQTETLTEAMLRERGHSSATRRALLEKGLVETVEREPPIDTPVWREGPTPSPEQAAALETIGAASGGFDTWLLHGITGSGKTEVYLRLITDTLAAGRQVLILVPEIGLTPQLISRLEARFDAHIAELHSNLAEGARASAWEAARSGRASIVIGTRSAIFTSLARPGLIVVDEEHDPSFKQQDGLRYSARDLAVKRGQLERVPVVLGSATPSLETLHNAQAGRYHWLRLTRRLGASRLPETDVLDVRGAGLDGGLSAELLNAIGAELELGNQVLLFLNRRGFAPTLQCHDCGYVASCHQCDARLTLHRDAGELRCHHCEWRLKVPPRCPQCHSRNLMAHGVGTERTEKTLQSRFSNYPVHRVDRDTMQRRRAMEDLTDAVHTGEPCILLGTQMLTKGHHFPNVTLVGLLDIDASLFSADFRGPERMGQLLTQVSGRAGRADKPGRVMLQTHYPDHPLLQALLDNGYDAFAEQLLAARRESGLPPTGHLALVRAEANQLARAERFLANLRSVTDETDTALQIIGPLPAPLQRKSGRFRAQLLLLGRSRRVLRRAVVQLLSGSDQLPDSKRLRWSLDIDPSETF
jgi:primosomal protein N' (replication factor Y)